MSSPAVPIVEAGAPFEHGSEPVQGTPPPAKTDLEKSVEKLQKDLETERTLRAEADANAKYWANRGRQAPAPTTREESDVEPPPDDDPAAVELNGEQLLDLLSKDGTAGLKKLGYVSDSEVKKLVREAEERAVGMVDARDREASFDQKLGTEFPELAEASKLLRSGKQPTDPLYLRTQEIYQEMLEENPEAARSKYPLLAAARQARAELKGAGAGKGKTTVRDDDDDDEPPAPARPSRRARVAAQAAEPRSTGGDDEGSPVLSDAQRDVIKRTGITEAEFLKNSGGGRRGRN